MVVARVGRVTKAIYLAAIGLATIGWLWLIVWVVRQMDLIGTAGANKRITRKRKTRDPKIPSHIGNRSNRTHVRAHMTSMRWPPRVATRIRAFMAVCHSGAIPPAFRPFGDEFILHHLPSVTSCLPFGS